MCLNDEDKFFKLLTESFNKVIGGETHKSRFNSRINLIPTKKQRLNVQEAHDSDMYIQNLYWYIE